MIEQLRSAADQLHAAWDNYYHIYSTLQGVPSTYDSPLEISHHLDTELAFISSCEPKIKQLKVAISRARSHLPDLAPINALPLETLSYIFHLALERPCEFYHYNPSASISTLCEPKFPDNLASVCSLWRRAATISPALWSHIDLSRDARWYSGLVARAKRHSMHVGTLPIELHVAEANNVRDARRHDDYEELHGFLSDISHRVKTLEIVVAGDFGPFHRCVLSGLSSGHNPALEKLITCSRSIHGGYTFIFADLFHLDKLDEELRHFSVHFTKDQLERSFSSLTVPHLCGIFPLWSSTAYHGLVDLRLSSIDQPTDIGGTQLLSILKSSPGLRILHFGLKIRGSVSVHDTIIPAHLQDLQVVKVLPAGTSFVDGHYLHPSHILPFLVPGTKPLWLSFGDRYPRNPVSFTELDSFFARSKVARFHTHEQDPPIDVLLRHSANLECVIFDDLNEEEFRARIIQDDGLVPSESIKSLRILHSTLSESDLGKFLKWCPFGTILEDSHIFHDKSWGTMLSKEELLDTFPMVTLLNPAGDPTAEWDLLD